jgi:hypothetical protein
MMHIVTNSAQKALPCGRPGIVITDLLEALDATVDFTYHIGSTPHMGVPSEEATTLTLQYYDAESRGELYSIILPDMPAWMINHIERGDLVQVVDSTKKSRLSLLAKCESWVNW